MVVGAPGNDAGGNVAGRVYVYDCNRYFVTSPNGGETWNVGATEVISWLGAEPADLSLSVDGGRTYDVLETGVGGAASNAIAVRVPHAPTRFARIKLTPANPALGGRDHSDSLFTIQTSVALLSFVVEPAAGGGAELSWSSDPGVGPAGLAGYRLYRLGAGSAGNGSRIGPDLITETRFFDPQGAPGHTYRLVAVNGFLEELELGRQSLAVAAPLAAWPLPYRGGDLTISFATSGFGGGAEPANVGIYDLSGRLVRTVAQGRYPSGFQLATWDGRDAEGSRVRNGIYFLRSQSGGRVTALKLVVIP